MPAKPKAMTVKRPKESEDGVKQLTLGNLRVDAAGIHLVEGAVEDPSVGSPLTLSEAINIDDLERKTCLGQGAQGNVELWRHKIEHGKKYAVKNITIQPGTNLANIAAEIRNIYVQRSDYTIPLYNAFIRSGKLMLVMQYMDWGNLEELLTKIPQLPEECAAYIADQLLHGLELLHTRQSFGEKRETRQVHRDIKPANVLLSREGLVKLADFGVAANAETIGVQSFVGTATYMSPERIRESRYSTPSDIWSVGIVIAQCLLGEYPFKRAGNNFMELLKTVTTIEKVPLLPTHSAEAQDFIDRCLKQQPELRASAKELLEHPWIKTRSSKPAFVKMLECDSVDTRQMSQMVESSSGPLQSNSPDRKN